MTGNYVVGALFALFAALSCSEDPPKRTRIELSDFDTSCTVATDCTPVGVGLQCPCRACKNAAINVADKPKYDAQRAEVDCGDTTGVGCAPCQNPAGVDCVAGKCELVK